MYCAGLGRGQFAPPCRTQHYYFFVFILQKRHRSTSYVTPESRSRTELLYPFGKPQVPPHLRRCYGCTNQIPGRRSSTRLVRKKKPASDLGRFTTYEVHLFQYNVFLLFSNPTEVGNLEHANPTWNSSWAILAPISSSGGGDTECHLQVCLLSMSSLSTHFLSRCTEAALLFPQNSG